MTWFSLTLSLSFSFSFPSINAFLSRTHTYPYPRPHTHTQTNAHTHIYIHTNLPFTLLQTAMSQADATESHAICAEYKTLFFLLFIQLLRVSGGLDRAEKGSGATFRVVWGRYRKDATSVLRHSFCSRFLMIISKTCRERF